MQAYIFPQFSWWTADHANEEKLNVFDINFDRILTFEEYLDQYNFDKNNQKKISIHKTHFSKLDHDGNGVLEGEELDLYINPDLMEIFAKESKQIIFPIDDNHDKLFSMSEFENHYTQFYRSKLGDLVRVNTEHQEL